IHGYEEQARRVAAAFRAGAGAHVDDQPIRGLVETLRRASPLFARLWDERQVGGREAGEWVVEHPDDGLLRYAPVVFDVAGRPDLTLTMFVPSASLPKPGTVLGAAGAA